MNLKERLKEIRLRADKATPVQEERNSVCWAKTIYDSPSMPWDQHMMLAICFHLGRLFDQKAHARTDIPFLLSEVEALQNTVSRYDKALEKCKRQRDSATRCYYAEVAGVLDDERESLAQRDSDAEDAELSKILDGGGEK